MNMQQAGYRVIGFYQQYRNIARRAGDTALYHIGAGLRLLGSRQVGQ